MKPQNLARPLSRTGHGRAATIGALAGAAILCVAAISLAQPAPPRDPRSTDLTILTAPPDARVTMSGASEVHGTAPLDVPGVLAGRYSMTLSALGYSSSQGVIFVPPRGGRPYLLSESPGLGGGLILRSLNLPGAPDISAGHTGRGIALATAAAGGLTGFIRADIFYLDDADKLDPTSQADAADWKYQRNIWAAYTGGVWVLSALDYIVRARVDLLESTPTRITVGAPPVGRGSVFLRSLLVPGAGQEFANHRGRSFYWLSAALASGAAYVIAVDSHHRIQNDLDRAEENLAAAPPEDVPAREAEVAHFEESEKTSAKVERNLGYLTLLVYVSNLIDAAVLMPIQSANPPAPSKVSLSLPVSPDGVGFAISRRF